VLPAGECEALARQVRARPDGARGRGLYARPDPQVALELLDGAVRPVPAADQRDSLLRGGGGGTRQPPASLSLGTFSSCRTCRVYSSRLLVFSPLFWIARPANLEHGFRFFLFFLLLFPVDRLSCHSVSLPILLSC
jgi:hypothetical protein